MIQKIKGTIDVLPDETPLYRKIESVMREQATLYGFGEIRTPTFENTELFERGVGDTTDVVQKEMYTFVDRDENRRISLRPEGTASVVRALLEHGCQSEPMPLKYFYLINCFRHEAPQAGRSREFFQFGAELFGAESPAADATMIALASSVFSRLGLSGITLHLNSIGCKKCRAGYRSALVSYFGGRRDELCDTCKTRLEKNPLRLLDCKSPICSAIAKSAPKTVDYLCDDCKAHFDSLTRLLDGMGIAYVIDPAIVRGLDYYTRTVFEFIADGIGAQSTVCGGGRYDGLVEELGGAPMPAIGFAMGITRVILALRAQGIADPTPATPRLYIAALGDRASLAASVITERLRRSGAFVECDLVGRSLKAQMKYANKIGADYALILGDNELDSRRASLRDMKNSTQTEVDLDTFTLP